MLKLNQMFNTICMYAYLLYYDYRLKSDYRFMMRELHAAMKEEMIKRGVIRG